MPYLTIESHHEWAKGDSGNWEVIVEGRGSGMYLSVSPIAFGVLLKLIWLGSRMHKEHQIVRYD